LICQPKPTVLFREDGSLKWSEISVPMLVAAVAANWLSVFPPSTPLMSGKNFIAFGSVMNTELLVVWFIVRVSNHGRLRVTYRPHPPRRTSDPVPLPSYVAPSRG